MRWLVAYTLFFCNLADIDFLLYLPNILLAASQMNAIAGFNILKLCSAVSPAATWTFFEYLTTFPAPKPLYTNEDKDLEDKDSEDEEKTFQLAGILLKFYFVLTDMCLESALYLCTTDKEVTTVSGILYWLLLQGWCDVQEQHVKISSTGLFLLLMVFDLKQIWTQAREEASQHPKCKKKLAAVNDALQAVKKRHENAMQVMTAALAADNDDKAQAALNMLTAIFANLEFYPS